LTYSLTFAIKKKLIIVVNWFFAWNYLFLLFVLEYASFHANCMTVDICFLGSFWMILLFFLVIKNLGELSLGAYWADPKTQRGFTWVTLLLVTLVHFRWERMIDEWLKEIILMKENNWLRERDRNNVTDNSHPSAIWLRERLKRYLQIINEQGSNVNIGSWAHTLVVYESTSYHRDQPTLAIWYYFIIFIYEVFYWRFGWVHEFNVVK